ncbi:hypothetical protein [Novosphingobium sp.]|uniref:hypothetical protein n=1 Tax=Novosphingobium sp. TaxID=1874826 RepID=UPI0025CBB4E8|nr:hypothetical protein [Novosphingobium sp.]
MSDWPTQEGRDPAVARFAVIQAMRASGAMLVMGGFAVLSHHFPSLAGVPDPVGYVLLGVGVVDFFVVPQVLAKRWRSPKP